VQAEVMVYVPEVTTEWIAPPILSVPDPLSDPFPSEVINP